MPIKSLLHGLRLPPETEAVIELAYDEVVSALGLRDSAACERVARLALELAEEHVLLDAAELRDAALAKIRGSAG
jgi:hypothetical protein